MAGLDSKKSSKKSSANSHWKKHFPNIRKVLFSSIVVVLLFSSLMGVELAPAEELLSKEQPVEEVEIQAEELVEDIEMIDEFPPVDLQLLGIGRNGHIAFNEPGTSFGSVTHKVKLTDFTIQANKRYFEKEDVPNYAYSMGLSSIMKAKKIILLAFSEDKAQAVKDLVTAEEATEDIPSTILINHPDVTVIVDEEATKLVK